MSGAIDKAGHIDSSWKRSFLAASPVPRLGHASYLDEEPKMTDWMFRDPPDVAVLTTRSIVRGGAWIARVSHDADDGGWQFHDDDPGPKQERDAMVVSLRSMVSRDDTLNGLADLPEGWCAWRETPTASWHREQAE